MKATGCLTVVLMAYFLQESVATEGTAPALLWSPEKSMSSLPEVTVDAVKPNALLQDYLSPLMKESTESSVIFLKNKLHVDDFTNFADVYSLDSNGGAFKNIKAFMENHFSLELPEVEDPLQAVDDLKASFDGVIHTAHSPSDVEKLNLSPDQKFLLIVELTPNVQMADEEQTILTNDATVGAICHHLQKRGIRYTAMFTGKPANENTVNAMETFSGRHLLATDDSFNGTFMNVSNMYVFLKDVQINIKQSGQSDLNFNLSVNADTADNSTVSFVNKTAVIRLSWQAQPDNGTRSYDLQIIISALNQTDRWVMNRYSLTVGGLSAGSNGSITDATLTASAEIDMVVPILYSYHCTNMVLYIDGKKNTSQSDFDGSKVTLSGFQLQPFLVQNDAFFNSQDCVGFFTSAIWMGIFCSLILLAILIWGSMMVLSLSTPDRFDDPKGKTITIAQAED